MNYTQSKWCYIKQLSMTPQQFSILDYNLAENGTFICKDKAGLDDNDAREEKLTESTVDFKINDLFHAGIEDVNVVKVGVCLFLSPFGCIFLR